MFLKTLKKISKYDYTGLIVRKADFISAIEFDYTPIEVAVLFGKRLLKPVDILSTMLYFINKGVLAVDATKTNKNKNIVVLKKGSILDSTLSHHELHILNYLLSFSENKDIIDFTELIRILSEKKQESKDSVKEFFNELDKKVYTDLSEKNYISQGHSTKKKNLLSLSLLFILLYSETFYNYLGGAKNLQDTILFTTVIFALISCFIVNYFYSKVSLKLNSNLRKDILKYGKIKSKFFLLKSMADKDINISFDNQVFFSIYWFILEGSYNKTYHPLKDAIFSFSIGIPKKRENSKKSFVKFTNLVSIASKKQSEAKVASTIFDNHIILKQRSNDSAKSQNKLESYLQDRLNVNEPVLSNNVLIYSVLKATSLMEKLFRK